MTEVFHWHPSAQAVGEAGDLRAALANPGQPFRFGGAGPLPSQAGMFETLTSGSSGQPRFILRTMASWTASFAVNAGLFGIGPDVQVAVLGDLQQSLALYGAVEALHLGATLHLLGGRRPDRQRLALSRVQILYATPAQLRQLVDVAGPDLPNLRLVLVGGSKLDSKLRHDLRQITGADIREFYGAAEASFITLAGPATDPASVGAAYPEVELSLRQGTVWLRSPYLFTRYGDGLPGSAIWDKDWLSVGEMGRIEGGLLYLSGRAGRMVTVADQNVFPEEMEAIMAGYTGVRHVAVLPRADGLRGSVMVAVILGDRSQEASILHLARQDFGALKAPRSVVWVDTWPVLPSGKSDLAALSQMVAL